MATTMAQMRRESGQECQNFIARVGLSGRVIIPREIRELLSIGDSEWVIFRVRDSSIQMEKLKLD